MIDGVSPSIIQRFANLPFSSRKHKLVNFPILIGRY